MSLQHRDGHDHGFARRVGRRSRLRGGPPSKKRKNASVRLPTRSTARSPHDAPSGCAAPPGRLRRARVGTRAEAGHPPLALPVRGGRARGGERDASSPSSSAGRPREQRAQVLVDDDVRVERRERHVPKPRKRSPRRELELPPALHGRTRPMSERRGSRLDGRALDRRLADARPRPRRARRRRACRARRARASEDLAAALERAGARPRAAAASRQLRGSRVERRVRRQQRREAALARERDRAERAPPPPAAPAP